jgi:hypothetical protein
MVLASRQCSSFQDSNRESAKFKYNLLGTPHTFNVTIYRPIVTWRYVLELLTNTYTDNTNSINCPTNMLWRFKTFPSHDIPERFATAQSRRMDCQDPQSKCALTKAEVWSGETMTTTGWLKAEKQVHKLARRKHGQCLKYTPSLRHITRHNTYQPFTFDKTDARTHTHTRLFQKITYWTFWRRELLPTSMH